MANMMKEARDAKKQIELEQRLTFEQLVALPADQRFLKLGIGVSGGRWLRLPNWDYRTYRAMRATLRATGTKAHPLHPGCGLYGDVLEDACHAVYQKLQRQPVTIDDFQIVGEVASADPALCLEVFRQEYMGLEE